MQRLLTPHQTALSDEWAPEVADEPRRRPEGKGAGPHQPADGELGRGDPAAASGEHQANLVRTSTTCRRRSPATTRRSTKARSGLGHGRGRGRPARRRPPPGRASTSLKASLAAIEKGTSLSEVLTYLVNEVSQYVDRAAMFIVKGPSAIGWYARGVDPARRRSSRSACRSNADTVFRIVLNSRHALRGHIEPYAGHRPGAGPPGRRPAGHPGRAPHPARQAGGDPLLRHRPGGGARAGRRPRSRSWSSSRARRSTCSPCAPKPAGVDPRPRARPPSVRPRSVGEATRSASARASRRRVAPAPPPAAAPEGEGASTVMFNAATFAQMKQQPAAPARPAPPSPARPAPPRGPRPLPGGAEGPRGRQALRAPGGERDQALQRGEGQRGPAQQGHLRAAEGRHRARPPDVRRPRRRRTSATPRTTSTTSSSGSWPGATPGALGPM